MTRRSCRKGYWKEGCSMVKKALLSVCVCVSSGRETAQLLKVKLATTGGGQIFAKGRAGSGKRACAGVTCEKMARPNR